jgi:hypothetical protein
MNRRWHAVFGASAALVVAGCALTALPGCSDAPQSSSRPAASQLKEGVNLLLAKDPSWGANAAYMKAGRVVYLESRVGALKPEVYRNDEPSAPPNEMDLRFVDQDGHTFWVQRGGDAFADSTWNAEIAASRHLSPSAYAHRTADFQLATEAAAAVASALPTGFESHAYHLTRFASTPLPTQDSNLKLRAEHLAANPPGAADLARNQAALDATPYSSFSYAQWSVFATDKYSMGLVCVLGVCAASHSSTSMWDYEGYFSAAAPTPCGTLQAGQTLASGAVLSSCDGAYNLVVQATDGNLVLYQGSKALWASNTSGHPGDWLVMQGDGNLVLYSSTNVPLWNSGTGGNAGAYFVVQTDSNLVVYDGSTPLWARTGTSYAHPQKAGPSSAPAGSGTFNGLGWVFAISACNHGDCYNNGAVHYDCSTESSWYYNTSVTGESSTALTGANDGTGGCQTAYNWDSGSGSHLCNDDAAYELWQSANHPGVAPTNFAVTNQASHCDGDLCGQSPSNFACNCAGSACSGDWNTPNCGGANF